MPTEAESAAQVARVYQRITARPRDHLERIESAARAYFRALRYGTPHHAWAAREALRVLLGEEAPKHP